MVKILDNNQCQSKQEEEGRRRKEGRRTRSTSNNSTQGLQSLQRNITESMLLSTFGRRLRTGKAVSQLQQFHKNIALYNNAKAVSRRCLSTTENPQEEKDKKRNWLQYIQQQKLTKKIESVILAAGLTSDKDLANILSQTSAVVLYSIATITVLGTVGVDTKPFLTGVGVTGFAAGFALKEIATNYFSGLLLVFSKPFKQGQYLKVLSGSGLEGEVESIDLRYVTLKTKNNSRIMIPSSVVYSNPILVSPSNPSSGN